MLKLKPQYFGHLTWRADSLEKTLMVGKTEGRRRRGLAEDEMVGWNHWLSGHELEQAPGDGEGQGSLVCGSPWGHKESDMREWLNNNNNNSNKVDNEGHKQQWCNVDAGQCNERETRSGSNCEGRWENTQWSILGWLQGAGAIWDALWKSVENRQNGEIPLDQGNRVKGMTYYCYAYGIPDS